MPWIDRSCLCLLYSPYKIYLCLTGVLDPRISWIFPFTFISTITWVAYSPFSLPDPLSTPVSYPALFLSSLIFTRHIRKLCCPWASGWIQSMESTSRKLRGKDWGWGVGLVASFLPGLPQACWGPQWDVPFPVRRQPCLHVLVVPPSILPVGIVKGHALPSCGLPTPHLYLYPVWNSQSILFESAIHFLLESEWWVTKTHTRK